MRPIEESRPRPSRLASDGFALEFELPIFNTHIEATKQAAQYTFDDAFIHGIQVIVQHFRGDMWLESLLYLAGLRLNRHRSLFGMFGFNAGELAFPFDDFAPRQGLDLLVNVSIFCDLTDHLLVGVETNLARNLLGPGNVLTRPQIHCDFGEHDRLQFGRGSGTPSWRPSPSSASASSGSAEAAAPPAISPPALPATAWGRGPREPRDAGRGATASRPSGASR